MLTVNIASITLSVGCCIIRACLLADTGSVCGCSLGWGSRTSKLGGRLTHKRMAALIADVLVGVVRSSPQSSDTHGSTFWLHYSAIGAITVITALKPGNLYKACSSETARIVALYASIAEPLCLLCFFSPGSFKYCNLGRDFRNSLKLHSLLCLLPKTVLY